MTLEIATPQSSALDQFNDYNSSGPLVKRATYSPAAGINWSVIGLILADATVEGDENTIVSAIEALSEITLVANPRFWGETPSSIELGAAYQMVLLSEAILSASSSFSSNQFSIQDKRFGSVNPPVGKKWMVTNCVLSTTFADQAAITNLESSLEAITGITTARVLLFSQVPANVIDISLSITTRMRIELIPA